MKWQNITDVGQSPQAERIIVTIRVHASKVFSDQVFRQDLGKRMFRLDMGVKLQYGAKDSDYRLGWCQRKEVWEAGEGQSEGLWVPEHLLSPQLPPLLGSAPVGPVCLGVTRREPKRVGCEMKRPYLYLLTH